MALLKRQVTGSRGVTIQLVGLDDIIKKLGQYEDMQMAAFREAAKEAGKIIQASMRAELEKNTGAKRNVNVKDMTDKAREQVANGTIDVRRLRTKAEKNGPLTEMELHWARERQKQGKSGKIKRQKTVKESVAISKYVSSSGRMGAYGNTGSLKKSINYRIWSPKAKKIKVKINGKNKWKSNSSGIVYLIAGPTKVVTAAYNEMAGEIQKVNTFNYAHLVERGHKKVVMGRKYPGMVPAYPFMRPGFAKVRMLASARARNVLKRHLTAARLKYVGRAGAA